MYSCLSFLIFKQPGDFKLPKIMINHKTIEIVRTVVGIIGNGISFFLFVSPVPTFIEIWKKKSVEQYKADPYLATTMNCALWVFYGLPYVHPNSLLVLSTNAIGLAIELTYLTIYFIFADRKKRLRMMAWVGIEVVALCIIATCTSQLFHTTKKRSFLVGILCVIFGLLMYVSPLTIMGKVIKTKSVKYMPLWLSIGSFANGVIWTIYAFLPIDPFVMIPNGLGAVSGAVQLTLYAYYYKSTPKDDDDVVDDDEEHDQKPAQLQMSSSLQQPNKTSPLNATV